MGCSNNVTDDIEQDMTPRTLKAEIAGSNPARATKARHEKAPWDISGGFAFSSLQPICNLISAVGDVASALLLPPFQPNGALGSRAESPSIILVL